MQHVRLTRVRIDYLQAAALIRIYYKGIVGICGL